MLHFSSSLIMLAALLGGEPAPIHHETLHPQMVTEDNSWWDRDLFKSDDEFCRFIGPITNPVFSKDPRSVTEARLLFVNNWTPANHPALGGGNFQVYAMQLRVALTDRLSIIADEDGYAVINPEGGLLGRDESDGFLNINVGLKYVLIRDVENQFLVTGGFMFEPQTGEAEVFQSHGDGLVTVFGTIGKEICEVNHVLFNFGHVFPVDRTENSGFFYSQLHLDRQLFGFLYPLVEANWFHYTSGGNRGIPAAVGEGDGLLNLGTSGVTGNDIFTVAAGLKAKLNSHIDVGAAYEVPISNRKDLLQSRVTAEMILRY